MICIESGQIQKYIDNEANNAEKCFIEKHMMECMHCREKIEARKHFSKLIIHSVNELVKDEPELSAFIPVRKLPRTLILRKRIIYSVSAACLLLFALFTIMNTRSKDPMHVTIVNTIGPEVDANRPITKQDMVIKVIDPDGKVSEFIVE